MEHGAWGNNFELRIAKLGTRPKGGGPKDKSAIYSRRYALPALSPSKDALCFIKSAIRNPQSEITKLLS